MFAAFLGKQVDDPRSSGSRGRRLLVRATAVLMALSGSGLFIATSPGLAHAAITAPFNQVFTANTTGNIQIRGNTELTCQDAALVCAASRAGSGQNNNAFFMTYVDVDSDATTFDSSSSTVNIPAGGSVLFAALVWGGNTTAGGLPANAANFGTGTAANSPTPANAGQVKFRVPGSATYTTVNSTRTSFLAGATGPYQGYADVTAAVQAAGNGSYTVANVQTATGTNIHGGWAMAIAYSNPTDPPRNLTIFSGFGSVAATNVVDFSVSGFKTPLSGAVNTTLGAISYEGDAASTGDQMQLGNSIATLQNITDALHPVANTFTSVLSDLGADSSTRSPKYFDQLGFDAATFNVNGFLTNGSTTAAIRLTSNAGGETYYPGVITFATDLYSPDVAATKSVALVTKAVGNTQAGVAEPGDTLQYTINATNTGLDNSVGTVLTDSIPAGTTYKVGSLTSGGSSLTDATGDDIGNFNGGTKVLTVNVGSGATSALGGALAIGASIAPITFQVTVNAGIADGAAIPNTASFAYSGATTGTAVTGASNAVTTPVSRHHSALAIAKTASQPSVQKGASTQVTYTLTASNSGPYDDPAVTITDALPAGAVVISATPSAGSCTTPAGSVVCTMGALANGASATVAVTVTLDAAADPAVDTATIAGSNVDSNSSDNTASRSTIVNTPPVANPDSGTTVGGSVTISVLANDTDADADVLTTSAGPTVPSKGSIVVNGGGTITYTAAAGQAGTDTFSYVASDGRGGTSTALVTITIPNAPPVAVADSSSTTPATPVTISVLANDTDPNIPVSGQSLSITAVTQPAGSKGTVTTNGSTVTFTPSGTFLTGSASFTYTISDGAGGTSIGNVTVSMANAAPTAVNDTASTPYLTPVTVDVLANDTDSNSDPLTVTAVSGASHGTTTITGSGVNTKVVYTPAAGWSGPDTAIYTVSDGITTSTAQVTVTTGNAAPTAGSFSLTVPGGLPTTVNVLTHASDPNSDPLTVTAGVAGHGTTSVDGSGNVIYTPDPAYAGLDSFSYTVDDGHGGSATATVTVTVSTQPPVANADAAVATGNAGSPVTIDALSNDTDAYSYPLTITAVTAPGHGTAAIVTNQIVYTPSAAYAGPDAFSYTIDDGHGGTASATVSVDVQNRAPVANADTAAATTGVAATINIVSNDTEPDGEALTLQSVDPTSAQGGTLTIVGTNVQYVSAAGFTGSDTFSYVVADPRGGTATTTVTVTVGAVPPPPNANPVAVDDIASVAHGVTGTVDVLANDSDADIPGSGQVLTVSSVSLVSGTASVSIAGGLVQVVPDPAFTGDVVVQYTVADGAGGTATAHLTVHVAAPVTPVIPPVTPPVLTPPGLAPPSRALVSVTADVTIGATKKSVGADPTAQVPGHGALTIVSVVQPSHGATVVVENGQLVVNRTPGFVGASTFSYVAMGADGTLITVTVVVHVLGESFMAPTLPFTGANITDLTLAGVLLLLVGGCAVWIGRPRRTEP